MSMSTIEQEHARAERRGMPVHTVGTCVRCLRGGDAEYLTDGYCSDCMAEAGLVECGNCGRVLHVQQTADASWIGESGRVIRARNCHACERELRRETV